MSAVTVLVAADGHTPLLLGPQSEAMRRELGMTAWVALESLVLDADLDDGQVVVAASARQLGGRLAIGKDRAAAALARLRAAGLLRRLATREDTSARFVAARYAIDLPVSSIEDTTRASATSARVATSRRMPRDEPDDLLRLDF